MKLTKKQIEKNLLDYIFQMQDGRRKLAKTLTDLVYGLDHRAEKGNRFSDDLDSLASKKVQKAFKGLFEIGRGSYSRAGWIRSSFQQ